MARFKSLFDEDWPRKRGYRGDSWGGWFLPKAPEPVYIEEDEWPTPKPREDQVFAKSCTVDNWCRTDAGTAPEPASNFGKIMVAGAMLLPSASTAVATAIGADLGLGRLAGVFRSQPWWISSSNRTLAVCVKAKHHVCAKPIASEVEDLTNFITSKKYQRAAAFTT